MYQITPHDFWQLAYICSGAGVLGSFVGHLLFHLALETLKRWKFDRICRQVEQESLEKHMARVLADQGGPVSLRPPYQ